MRPWFAALAASCICLSAQSQQLPPQAGAPAPAPPATAAPATGTPPAAAAQPSPVYRVELLVFRALSAIGSPENWNAENGGAGSAAPVAGAGAGVPPGAPASPQASPSPPPAASPSTPSAAAPADSAAGGGVTEQVDPRANVRPLPASAYQMESIAARLRSSGRYLPVAHVAWTQTASPWGHPIEIPVQSLGIDPQGLTGTVSLQRGQYLHLELSLDYAMDTPPAGLRAPPGTVFSLREVHRVRFYERNYFDHPAFGVIALVTPLQESRHARR